MWTTRGWANQNGLALNGNQVFIGALGGLLGSGRVYTYRLGSYEKWAGARFSSAVGTEATADPDGDSAVNLLEFVAGSDPLLITSRPLLTFEEIGIVNIERRFRVRYSRGIYDYSSVNVNFQGGDLQTWQPAAPVIPETGFWTVNQTAAPVSAAAWFFRFSASFGGVIAEE